MEEQKVAEKTIPVFTVMKNGAILKNIFVVNSRDFSGEIEEIVRVGRHPDCDILLTHPSISRLHLEIRSIPSRQRLFVTDLSSVHGTWVADQKVEPGACVEVMEGDVIRIGGSTRTYRLYWIPLSRAYDIHASTPMNQEEENRMLEIAHKSHTETTSGDDGDSHLDVTSEGTGSSVPSEDEDTYISTQDISLPLASPTTLSLATHSVKTEELQFNEDLQASPKWDLDVAQDKASMQQTSGYPEAFGCSDLQVSAEADERYVSGNRVLHINVMSERSDSSVSSEDEDPYLEAKEASSIPLPTDSTEVEKQQLTEDVKASQKFAINITEANAENPVSCCFPSKGQIVGCIEALGCSPLELAAEVDILSLHREVDGGTEFITKQVVEASAEPLTKDVTQSHGDSRKAEVSRQIIAVSASSFPLTEPILENITEDSKGLLGSEFQSTLALETDSENIYQKNNGETKVGSRQANAVSDCLFAGNESLSRIITEDIQSLFPSGHQLPESEVGALSETGSELNPADNEHQNSGMRRETEKLVYDGSSSCLCEDLRQSVMLTPIQKSKPETSKGSEVSEESYSISGIGGEGNAVKGIPFPSTLAAKTFEDTKRIEELPSGYTGNQENQTPQADAVRDDVLSEINSSRSSSGRLSTCNIWSRRGKDGLVLQIRTNSSKGKQKQIGDQPKSQLQRKQAFRDKSISLTVHHDGENFEPEIFTPDKENLTPRSHMLRRLQDIGDIKDIKSSSKLSRSSCSSKIPSVIDIITSEALTEPEIFTPDKENLTPNSHMLKRLRDVSEIKETKGSSSKATSKPVFGIHLEENVMAEQKLDLNCMSSTSKVKHEVVALTNRVERTPFQPLLEKSSAQNQSFTEASSTASARTNISRGIRSSSNLSDGKNKMKWTIVLDTSSLLDKESRKPLHLLQGLKGTQLVVPRTVLREVDEMKRSRSLFFSRKSEIASSALDWIEECTVNTKWWIKLQTLSEETKATAPTPPVTPQLNGSAAFPFSLHWNRYAAEIDSPTSQDQVLECALLYRNINSNEKLVVLSNDVTLKIKAMAEGVICETAHEFYKSLVNPFSERFMWRESSARGRTWSQLDDVVSRESYNSRRGERGAAAKGLKLILLHNSRRYGLHH